jgi:alkylation response protein AidB-like acyl-CoA dehydrogenase
MATEFRGGPRVHRPSDHGALCRPADHRDASMVKWWNTEPCNRVTDRCVQLHGGYGYMRECADGRA